MKMKKCITTLQCSIFFLLSSFLFVACNNLDDQLAKQAQITGQASADESVIAANSDLKTKSTGMEADLELKQKFYQGVSGRFSGFLINKNTGEKRQVHIEIAATVPPYRSNRTRSLEEIIADMNALQLVVRVSQLTAASQKVACTFTGIRPDMHSGSIELIDPACNFSYELFLSAVNTSSAPPDATNLATATDGSTEVATQLESGAINQVNRLFLDMDSAISVGTSEATTDRTNDVFDW